MDEFIEEKNAIAKKRRKYFIIMYFQENIDTSNLVNYNLVNRK